MIRRVSTLFSRVSPPSLALLAIIVLPLPFRLYSSLQLSSCSHHPHCPLSLRHLRSSVAQAIKGSLCLLLIPASLSHSLSRSRVPCSWQASATRASNDRRNGGMDSSRPSLGCFVCLHPDSLFASPLLPFSSSCDLLLQT